MQRFVQYIFKFFAILKDSLQETLDSKVLYAMLILSALVIVATASISFDPKPAEQGVEGILGSFPGAGSTREGQEPPLRYELQDFKQTDPAKPWESEMHFTIIVHEHSLPGMEGKEAARGLFQFFVLLDEDENLNPEEKSARKNLRRLFFDAVVSGNEDKMKAFLKELAELLPTVTTAQMEGFIANHLSAQGNMVAGTVRLAPDDKNPVRFLVDCKAKSETKLIWPHKMAVGFGGYTVTENAPVGLAVYLVEDKIVGGVGAAITMLIASIVTSFFIPNMLRKGTIDFLLAKPIPRWLLLVYKYVGGLLFMFLNTVVVIVGIWIVLGVRSGIWSSAFLLSIPVFTLQFAIFYAVSTVLGVLTRSPIVSILAACFVWFVLFAVGWVHVWADSTRDSPIDQSKPPIWLDKAANVANQLLPRYKDLDVLTSQATIRDLIGADSPQLKQSEKAFAHVTWTKSILVTLLYIAVLLAIASWWFATKDY